MKLCRWEERDADLAEIKTRLDAGEWSIDPFVSLSHLVEPALHRRCAEFQASRIAPAEG